MIQNKHILFCVAIVCLCACNAPSIHEARQTVAQADSLWAVGASYDDSLSLAQACETLDRWQWFNADDYAHACYHYGRLLRAKDHPVEAMQVFINATHSRTRDYHILGRVYSNMGDIAHLAGEYPLAYDMYEKSGEMYLRNGDTLLYYYDLNNMAFEKALHADKTTTLSLVREIENNHCDEKVLMKTIETKAELYLKCRQYDSAIYYASELHRTNNSLSYLIRAQAYSQKEYKDSAVYYADRVLMTSIDLSDINNALYILTNDDLTKDKDAIREIAANRADIQKCLKIKQGKLSQAVQLLEQDLHRKPDLRWLYVVLAIILFIGSGVVLYHVVKRRQQLQNQRAKYANTRKKDIEISCTALRNSKNIKQDLDWDNYQSMCDIINARLGGLEKKLTTNPRITNNDVRLCVLFLLNFSYTETAEILNISQKSIAKLKSNVAHKLGVSMRELQDRLFKIVCEEDV